MTSRHPHSGVTITAGNGSHRTERTTEEAICHKKKKKTGRPVRTKSGENNTAMDVPLQTALFVSGLLLGKCCL